MTTWSLMIISNGMLTTCPILRAPEIQAPRPVIGLPLDGHVVERPNAMSITCSISASSSSSRARARAQGARLAAAARSAAMTITHVKTELRKYAYAIVER